ncbi:MAG: spiro-SPASM protein [Treponema sp.]|jgi:spiro-SPASM protein|nr:spiro-SPASM protein [Treponema sp.]
MNAILILFGGNLSGEAFEPLLNEKNSFYISLEQAKKFPGVKKTVLLAPSENFNNLDLNNLDGVEIEQAAAPWTKRSLLEKIAGLEAGFDCVYFAFADCPFLDPAIAGAMADRHTRYAAEYSYADGWPYGLAPEILSPGTAAILAKISGDDGPVERDILFSVIQKDINAFDIETEISPVDLRCHRLNLCADSKRNLLLLNNFIFAAGGIIPDTSRVEKIIEEQPQILRTLPAFYPIQVSGSCPQKCSICPYPLYTDTTARKDFMETDRFESLLEKIAAFSGDAVIDLSLWGELSLHPEKMKLIEAVLSRRELALVIETSGIGWKAQELEMCAELSQKAQPRKNSMPPLSWIVSFDTLDPKRYAELRGNGYVEAETCAKKLLSLFPKDCYVQAVRVAGAEDDTEKFYRYWKENAPSGEKNIIIQKYDDFCGIMEKKQASDISPVIRQPCWHIMRDMPVLIDGTVPLCREELNFLKEQSDENSRSLGNVFTDSLESIWQKGIRYYSEHCKKNYTEICANCDEYYTYNF